MSTPYRFIPEEAKRWTDRQGRPIAVVEVTIRTILGFYLLKPTGQNTRLILGVLGRAKELLDFELYGYAYLSNHGSLLLGVRDAEHLARIMEYIHGNIARELGRKENSDWAGRFWSRRGRAILVLTDEDLAQRMKYLLSNSTKEGLVTHPARWPGAHCARALCDGKSDVGTWVNRTQLRLLRAAARGTGTGVSEADATSYYRVELEQLPCWSHLSAEQYKQQIRALCNDISVQAAHERARTGRTVVGAKRILRLSAHHRPDGVAKSPAPPIHCRDRTLRMWFVAAYKAFVDAYRAAYERLHQVATSGEFPPGGVPPTRVVIVQAL
jgi:hypothetical protein